MGPRTQTCKRSYKRNTNQPQTMERCHLWSFYIIFQMFCIFYLYFFSLLPGCFTSVVILCLFAVMFCLFEDILHPIIGVLQLFVVVLQLFIVYLHDCHHSVFLCNLIVSVSCHSVSHLFGLCLIFVIFAHAHGPIQ